MFVHLKNALVSWIEPLQLAENQTLILAEGLTFVLLFGLALLAYYISWFILRRTLIAFIQRTDNKYDDVLLKNKVINRFSYLVPSYIISSFVHETLPSFPLTAELIQSAIHIYVIIVGALIIDGIINSGHDIYKGFQVAKSKPIKGFIQVLKIVLWIAVGLMILATFIGQPISSMLIGLGTLSAVLMLVFKDPILGFVGGMQLSFNDMVRIGDWISMPKYGADGTVLEITLTTVKVQNWDQTITTIPTYSLVTDYFQNWRGMEESGGRRIKRHISIDMESVRFCTKEMLERFKTIQLISGYLDEKEKDIEAFNKANNIDTSNLANGRHQTNLGVFRAYMKAYLRSHPRVHQGLIMLVRHLQPTDKGIPLEIYVFSNRQAWAEFEDLQSDIFDHILAVMPQFELSIFQAPNNRSLSKLTEALQSII